MTISETSCAKPSSRRPITFMGNWHGKVRSGFSGCCAVMRFFIYRQMRAKRAKSSHRRAFGRELRLVLLVERVHALEERPGLAAAHGLAVERRHGEHLLRGRG